MTPVRLCAVCIRKKAQLARMEAARDEYMVYQM